jgi:predicted nuclease of predicted toxin-antitoxin system
VRFFLDNDVPVSVGRMLGRKGHQWWTASNAGQAEEADDDLTVYADEHDAVLITHDREFTTRRKRTTIGRHIRLDCPAPCAAETLEKHLNKVVELLVGREHVCIEVGHDKVNPVTNWS